MHGVVRRFDPGRGHYIMEITYDETRLWVQWVRVFTPSDLAKIMAVPPEVIFGHLTGMTRHGTIEDTGDRINGAGYGEEPIFSFIPLPPGPTHHPHKTPPERIVGYDDVQSPRGLPIRIRTEDRKRRQAMSTPGARGRMKRQEANYWRQEEARRKRAAVQAAKSEGENEKRFAKAGKRSRRRAADWEDFS